MENVAEKIEMVTAREAWHLLGVSEGTFYKWLKQGRFDNIKVKFGPHKCKYIKSELIRIYNQGWE